MIDWEEVGPRRFDELSQESRTEIVKLAGDFADNLENRPGNLSTLKSVFAHHLDTTIDTETFVRLKAGLGRIISQDHVQFVMWIMTQVQSDYDLDWLSNARNDELVSAINAMYAMYGDELESAVRRAGELPDDWESVVVQRFWDVDNERYRLRVELNKYSGETLSLEGDPNSIMRLSTLFDRALASLDAADAFEAESVKEYFAASSDLTGVFERARGEEGVTDADEG